MDENSFISKIEDLGFVRGLIDEDSGSIILTKTLSEEGIEGPRLDIFSNPDNPGEWRIGYFEDTLDPCGNAFATFESGKDLLDCLWTEWMPEDGGIPWKDLAEVMVAR